MDDAKRRQFSEHDAAQFFSYIGRRANDGCSESVFPMGGYFNEMRRVFTFTACYLSQHRPSVRVQRSWESGRALSLFAVMQYL